MMERISVIKVGGAVVEDSTALSKLLDKFAKIPGAKILIHGGGRSATRIAASLGIESQMIGGRRVTDQQMLQVVTMVYGGLVNKNIVVALQKRGINAVGLTGADMNLILSHKRAPKEMKQDDGSIHTVDFGFVGDVDEVDGKMLATLISNGLVPVMAPLTHDGKGHLLNTNADTIASQVACALTPYYEVTLTFCFEKKGVLANPDDEQSVIRNINETEFLHYVDKGIIAGGMRPKLENSFDAIHQGVKQVIITSAEDPEGTQGTIIKEF
ncbi:MAG: acetylglutamate kinase [Bacteroidaceae bacterium]